MQIAYLFLAIARIDFVGFFYLFIYFRGGEVGELGRAWLVLTSFSHKGVLPCHFTCILKMETELIAA